MAARANSPARPLSETPDIKDYSLLNLGTPINGTPLATETCISSEKSVGIPARALDAAAEIKNHEAPSLHTKAYPTSSSAGKCPFSEPAPGTPARPLEEGPEINHYVPLSSEIVAAVESSTSGSEARSASPARPLEEEPEIDDYEPLSPELAGPKEVLVSPPRVASPARSLEESLEIPDFGSLPALKQTSAVPSSSQTQATSTGANGHENVGHSHPFRPELRFKLNPSVGHSNSNKTAPMQQPRRQENGTESVELVDSRPVPSRTYSNTFLTYREARDQHRLRTRAPAVQTIPPVRDQGTQRDNSNSRETRPHDSSNADRALIAELRETTNSQSELITELKIRVAVVENDLKHAEKERDGAIHQSATMAQVLGSTVSSSQFNADREERDALRRENKMLKREIAVLWKRLESRKVPRTVSFDTSHDSSSSEEDDSTRHLRVNRSSRTQGKGKNIASASAEARFSAMKGGWGGETSRSAPSALTSVAGPSSRALNAEESFESGSTTVPNSPIVHATPHPLPPLQPSINSSIPTPQSFNRYTDIGIESLEDVLGGAMDGFPPPLKAELEPLGMQGGGMEGGVERERLLDREGRGIDVELREQMEFQARLENLPTPGVLKTGFEVGGSFRGRDYDLSQQAPTEDHLIPRGPRRTATFNRFIPASLSTDPTRLSESLEGDRTLFTSEDQVQASIEIHKRTCGFREPKYPDFFRYGLQYVPGENESEGLRTVIISNLPTDIELREVLARVRGGQIINSVLLNTIPITGSMSAMVQFLHENAAGKYVDYTQEHPITFGDEERIAEITLIPTPTFPFKHSYRRPIFELNHTRMIAIPNFPENVSLTSLQRALTQGNGHRANLLVEIFLSSRNTLHLEFSSINGAGSAYGILNKFNAYRGLEVCWEPDSCAGPLEELELPMAPRPPMLPRGRQPSVDLYKSSSSIESQRDRSADENDCNDVDLPQRKRLAALQNQQISIPSFSGAGIQSSSWADEVIDEVDSSEVPSSQTDIHEPHSAVPPNSPQENPELMNAIIMKDMNQAIASGQFRKPPIGLAGSKYASLVPSFEDQTPDSKSRNQSEKQPESALPRDIGNTPSKIARFFEKEDSESERSYSQTATRHLADLEAKTSRKTPPRVNLASLLASPPLSPGISQVVETAVPSNRLSDDELQLRVDLQPFVTTSTQGSEKRKTYPTPDTSTKKYVPAGSWTEKEAETLAALNADGKMVLGEMIIESLETQKREREEVFPVVAESITSEKKSTKTLVASNLGIEQLDIPVTPTNQTRSYDTSSPLNSDSISPERSSPLPANIVYNTDNMEFQRGREFILRDDPFRPRSDTSSSELLEINGAVKNPDEISLDCGDDEVAVAGGEMIEEKAEVEEKREDKRRSKEIAPPRPIAPREKFDEGEVEKMKRKTFCDGEVPFSQSHIRENGHRYAESSEVVGEVAEAAGIGEVGGGGDKDDEYVLRPYIVES